MSKALFLEAASLFTALSDTFKKLAMENEPPISATDILKRNLQHLPVSVATPVLGVAATPLKAFMTDDTTLRKSFKHGHYLVRWIERRKHYTIERSGMRIGYYADILCRDDERVRGMLDRLEREFQDQIRANKNLNIYEVLPQFGIIYKSGPSY